MNDPRGSKIVQLFRKDIDSPGLKRLRSEISFLERSSDTVVLFGQVFNRELGLRKYETPSKAPPHQAVTIISRVSC